MAKRPNPRREARRANASPTVPTKEDVLAFIESAPEKVGKRELARHFAIKGPDRRALKELMAEMEAEGLLVGNRKHVRPPGTLPPVTVMEIARFDSSGELIAEPVTWDQEEGPRPAALVLNNAAVTSRTSRTRDTRAPGLGDRVLARLARLDEPTDDGATYSAQVIRRLPREKRRLLGIFRTSTRGGGVILPIDRKSLNEWPVAGGDEGEAADGDLVRFDTSRTGHRTSRARILETLGNPDDEGKISLIAVHANGLPDDFPEPVLDELEALQPPNENNREDLRNLSLLTIDPADARDHDDAVHAQFDTDPANDGGFIVTVAIADVANYVRPGTRLDREARIRANSVYFPDRVVPMLPERISNDLCSLREAEERPCLAVRMIFDRSGTKRGHTFTRAMMRSAAKLSYEDAQAAFDGAPPPHAEALMDTALTPLWHAYQALKNAREKRAPLDLNLPERRIRFNDAGHVAGIYIPERLEAHRLIEEMMIQANVAAAETLEHAKAPVIYRAHDKPSREKLKSLSDFLETLELRLPKSDNLRPKHFNGVLQQAQTMPVPELVNEVILRAQAQAEYTTENYGHFGLNLRRYAHFTSPIRRYADLLVHRALISALKLGDGGMATEQAGELAAIAEDISLIERRAMAAERETIDRLIAGFLQDKCGAEFEARISGVTRSGLFVRLRDTGADGYIPAASLSDDYYHYVEDQHALVGDRKNLAFRLGDSVTVRLLEVVATAGALRFEMLSDGRRGHVSLAKGWRAKRPHRGGRRRRT